MAQRGSGAEAPADILMNAYATVRTLPELTFAHVSGSRRDLSDPELGPHLNGFMGYVASRGDREMTTGRYQLLRHLERTRHHLNFSVARDASEETLDALAEWAQRANAIFFLPNGAIHGSDLSVVLNAEGAFEVEELPVHPEAEARRQRSLRALGPLGRLLPASMSVSLAVEEAELPTPAEILERSRALFHLLDATQWAQIGTRGPAPTRPAGLTFTPDELGFLDSEPVDVEAAERLSWRAFALRTLVWAITPGGADLDLPPDRDRLEADLDRLMRGRDRLELRPTAEILDALDLVWRQHWLCREAVTKGQKPPLFHDDIMERHHALNWLTGFCNPFGTEWDDIDTPT